MGYLRILFKDLFYKNGYDNDNNFDWIESLSKCDPLIIKPLRNAEAKENEEKSEEKELI